MDQPILSPTTAATNAITATATMFSRPVPASTEAAISTASPGTGRPKSSISSSPPTATYPYRSRYGAATPSRPGSAGAVIPPPGRMRYLWEAGAWHNPLEAASTVS
jgi:hypothetical protein